MAAVGGYVRRKDRFKEKIGHLRPDCPYCGIKYADVKAGIPHPMNDGLHPWYYHSTLPLRFEPFDVGSTNGKSNKDY